MTRRRPLSPGTVAIYHRLLERAFGSPPYEKRARLGDWPTSSLKILRAAAAKLAPQRLQDIPEEVYEVSRVVQPPSEVELRRFEGRIDDLSPARRAMVLLPLDLGLRANEVLHIQRKNVERAAAGVEDLLIVRKGGKEQLLPSEGIKVLLQDLLTEKWQLTWQILSSTSEEAAYRTLHRMIAARGIRGPHKLRHGFATRMMRAGADLSRIQVMLNHASSSTTTRYVHPEMKDIKPFLPKRER